MGMVLLSDEQLEALVERVVRRVIEDGPKHSAVPLTSEQAAEELGVTVQTIERWARGKKLEGERRGRRWRFRREIVEAFRAGGEDGSLVERTMGEMLRGGRKG